MVPLGRGAPNVPAVQNMHGHVVEDAAVNACMVAFLTHCGSRVWALKSHRSKALRFDEIKCSGRKVPISTAAALYIVYSLCDTRLDTDTTKQWTDFGGGMAY